MTVIYRGVLPGLGLGALWMGNYLQNSEVLRVQDEGIALQTHVDWDQSDQAVTIKLKKFREKSFDSFENFFQF